MNFPFRLSVHTCLLRHDLYDITIRKSIFLAQIHLLFSLTELLVINMDR